MALRKTANSSEATALTSSTTSSITSSTEQEACCPICGAPGYAAFFELSHVPTEEGRLLATREEALAAPTGDIRLAFCRDCGYVGNALFDASSIKYDEDYSFSLHHSPVYQQFITALADRLTTRYDLRGKTVLEIACGQGDFLRLLCDLGNNRGIGIDPSLKQQVMDDERSGRIRYIRDRFSEKYAQAVGDFVCCRHLLNTVPDPKGFVQSVRRAIGQRPDTIVYFEVPNGAYIFDQSQIWNIVYERCSWFTPHSLARLFEISGFEVLVSEPCYQRGQYLGIDARPMPDALRDRRPGPDDQSELAGKVSDFAAKHQLITQAWQQRLKSFAGAGRRAVAWGAGASAISFFNTFHITDQIPYVVDINPQIRGQYLPGTGQRVIAPEELVAYKPDLVIITNPTYEGEIRQQVAALGAVCEFQLL
jgi:2-polyprenyl-3-methyl-5-hydroxy-6-metoxy-1,4-benzoquinol methylase